MHIAERRDAHGKAAYDVSFEERRLEDVVAGLNRFQRSDEQPFEAVSAMSEFNQRAYELFAQPLVQGMANEYTAKMGRTLHPLRMQRWSMSDFNPATWWLKPAAEWVKQHRQAVPPEHPMRSGEKLMSELTSAAMDYRRAVRDASSEAMFFHTYGNMFSLYLADRPARSDGAHERVQDPSQLPIVQEALASMDHGGYAAATARAAYLLARKGEPLELSRLELKKDLMVEYKDLLPAMSIDEARRVRGEQELIVRYAPEQAIESLPRLLPEKSDRDRFLSLFERLLADQRVQKLKPLPEQVAMMERIRTTVGGNGASRRRPAGRSGARSAR